MEGSYPPPHKDPNLQAGKREDLTREGPVTEQRGSWWFIVTALALAIFLGFGGLGLVWIFARPIAVLILGITLAAAIHPLIRWMSNWIPRVLAVAIVYILLFAIVAGLIWVVTPPLVNQLTAFSNNVPNLVDQIQSALGSFASTSNVSTGTLISDALNNFGTSLVSLPATLLSSLFEILVVVFLSVYALIDLPAIRRYINSLFPNREVLDVDRLLSRMGRSMGGYVRGAIINGLVIGLLTYLGLIVIGVDFPLVLSLIAGSLELIPVIGPIVAAIPMVLIAYMQSPTTALITLAYATAMHQFEGHILVPNIMRSQTEVTQLFVVIAVFAGYSVGGVLGILAAIPLAAAAWVFMDEIVAPPVRKQTGAPENDDSKSG